MERINIPVTPKSSEELPTEHMKMANGKIIREYCLHTFSGQLDMSLRLRDSVRRLNWIVAIQSVAIFALAVYHFIA